MNEKLSRPQFTQMDTIEKQTLMESLADRYDMTFLGLHTFDRWGQSCTTQDPHRTISADLPKASHGFLNSSPDLPCHHSIIPKWWLHPS